MPGERFGTLCCAVSLCGFHMLGCHAGAQHEHPKNRSQVPRQACTSSSTLVQGSCRPCRTFCSLTATWDQAPSTFMCNRSAAGPSIYHDTEAISSDASVGASARKAGVRVVDPTPYCRGCEPHLGDVEERGIRGQVEEVGGALADADVAQNAQLGAVPAHLITVSACSL